MSRAWKWWSMEESRSNMADNENMPLPAMPVSTFASSEPAPCNPCAICGKAAVVRYKPFCSARCADIDLGRWLKGNYVIPGEAVEETETGLPGRERDEDG